MVPQELSHRGTLCIVRPSLSTGAEGPETSHLATDVLPTVAVTIHIFSTTSWEGGPQE